MKRTASIFTFLLSLLFAAATFAADYGTSAGMKEKTAGMTSAVTRTGMADQRLISVNRLLGNSVESQTGEALGEINNVILDSGSGRIAYVMVNTGSFLSNQAKLIPYKALDVSEAHIRLNMDKEKLANAPSWTEETSGQEFDLKTHEFFGVAPYWVE